VFNSHPPSFSLCDFAVRLAIGKEGIVVQVNREVDVGYF
jgi:hypothetical protein